MFLAKLPGEPATVRSGALRLSETATLIRECRDTMQRLVDGEAGTSKGLDKAIERARVVIPRLGAAAERYDVAGAALLEFSSDQDTAIEAADAAILRYEQADEEYWKLTWGEVPEDGAEAHQSALDDARDDRAAALAAYNRARDDYDDAGDRADRLIEDVVKDSSLNDSMWDDIKGLGEDIAGFVGDVAEVVKELAASLLGLALILGPLLGPAGALTLLLRLLTKQPGEVSDDVQRRGERKYFRNEDGYRTRVPDYYRLAADAYGDDGAPDGWERLSEGALRAHGITMTDDDGFDAVVYRNKTTGEIVVAYRGTEPTSDPYNDVTEDLINGGGLPSSQAQQAIDLATQVTDAFGTDDVHFTGHSLGGGLAAAASVATGAEATTFNAAGIGATNYDNAASAHGDGASADNVVNFHTGNDPLTLVQTGSQSTPPAGTQITVESNSPDWQLWAGHGTGEFPWADKKAS